MGNDDLALAMKLIWGSPNRKATHYKISKFTTEVKYGDRSNGGQYHYFDLKETPDAKCTETLILLWHEERNAVALPYPINLAGAVEFTKGWLANTDYGPQPDHDGDNEKAWRVFCDHWGHVYDHHYGIAGIQPRWAMFSK